MKEMRKTYLIFIGISLFISGLSIFLYDYFTPSQKIVIQEKIPNAQWVKNQENFWPTSKPEKPFFVPTNFIDACRRITEAVVYIKSKENMSNDIWGETYMSTSGSGVIVSPEGYIVTNNHVVEGDQIEVVLNNKQSYQAKIVGRDPSTDLALLKVEYDTPLPFATFGDSDSLQVGEWVLAVGNPFKLQSTVTAGIVSAKARDINILQEPYGIESFIQTDAAVNQGNSGGALVNTRGDLVGINTAIVTYSGRYEGYSFAVPINLVKKVISDLKEFGTVHRGLLGVDVRAVDSDLAKVVKLSEIKGVYISRVKPNSGAAAAGLQFGDIILSVNKKEVSNMSSLLEYVGRHRPGDTINLSIWRDEEILPVKVELKNHLQTNELVNVRKDEFLKDLGFEIRDLIQAEKDKLDVKGIKVISIYKGSTIERTKMEPGFIITHLNERLVENADDFAEMLEQSKGRIVLQGVYENYEGPFWYVFSK